MVSTILRYKGALETKILLVHYCVSGFREKHLTIRLDPTTETTLSVNCHNARGRSGVHQHFLWNIILYAKDCCSLLHGSVMIWFDLVCPCWNIFSSCSLLLIIVELKHCIRFQLGVGTVGSRFFRSSRSSIRWTSRNLKAVSCDFHRSDKDLWAISALQGLLFLSNKRINDHWRLGDWTSLLDKLQTQ